MKFFSLFAVGACANQVGLTVDPNDAMNQLSMLMAGSQMALGKAQRHHQKLVDRMRTKVEQNFVNESETFGEQIGHYVTELKTSEVVFEGAIVAGVSELQEEEKVPSKQDDWRDPAASERALFHAQLKATNRTLQHMQRMHGSAVREAEEDVAQAFDDAGMKLSMKLGDLTRDSEDAKKLVSKSADKVQATPIVAATKFIVNEKDQQARLQQYAQELKNSQQISVAAAEVAEKKFAAFLAKAVKEVDGASDKVLADLAKAQKMEIEKEHKHQPTLAPLKTQSDAPAHGKVLSTTAQAPKVSTSSATRK